MPLIRHFSPSGHSPSSSRRLTLCGYHFLPSSRLRLAIATATLLSACSTVTPPAPNEQGDDMFGTRSMSGRDNAARVLIAPGAVGSEAPVAYSNIWERIAHGYGFSLDLDNERIDKQLAAYIDNPHHLHAVSERAAPFIFEIVQELEKRGMPTELALLPVVESAYNPNAANGGSVGLWQIMNTTATSLGLRQDWWYDGRRDPLASTSAALDYLSTLHDLFGQDWALALAAYNSGLGTVQRAIEKNQARSRGTDYWSLDLPRITEEFVPRLIAVSRIFASPSDYGLELSDVLNEPAVTLVDAGTQIDLAMAASLAGVDTELIYQLNPGYRQWATHPDGPHKLLLPIDRAEAFTTALADLGASDSRVTWDRYIVQSGDTLGAIANRYGTQVSALQQANGIKGSRIIAGESLLIPRAYNSSRPLVTPNAPEYPDGLAYAAGASSVPARYEVRSGDSLWRIANRYSITVESLVEWNDLDVDATLRPGQLLVLQPDSVARTDAAGGQSLHYRVQSGDSLTRIASRYGVSVDALAGWNNITVDGLIHPGQELVVHPGQTSLN